MKTFIKKGLLLLFPVLLWGLIVVIVDPFNYFSFSLIDNSAKQRAESLNTLMYRTIDYMKDPSENMLIGDSRTNALPVDLLEELTGKNWKKLNTNAAKLNEVFDLFYMANERLKLKSIVIGINFNMFNEFGYMDRVSGLRKVLDNPLMYVYNVDVAEATLFTMKDLITGEYVKTAPDMTKEEFWKWNITTKATHWYGKYKFPDDLYAELIAFDKFTSSNGIEAIFIIVPHHKEFHGRLLEFGLEDEEHRFKEIMNNLNAKVYDYDYENEITLLKSNFTDPVHYNQEIGDLIVKEIFTNDLKVGIKNH